MNEQEPGLRITYNGETLEATPERVVLYTFLGRTAIGNMIIENSSLDHVYVKISEEDEDIKGFYVFEQFNEEMYTIIAQYAIENDYQQILNIRQVPESDLRAYFAYQDKAAEQFSSEIPDFLPDDLQ